MFRLHELLRLVDVELHAIQLAQQIVRELDIGLVDLVDQQHRLHIEFKGLPELALDDVVSDIVRARIAELRIAQAAHRIVFAQALLRLAGRLDVLLEQRLVQHARDLLCQLGLAGTGLTFDQQRPLQYDRGIHREAQILGGDVAIGAAEARVGHDTSAAVAGACY